MCLNELSCHLAVIKWFCCVQGDMVTLLPYSKLCVQVVLVVRDLSIMCCFNCCFNTMLLKWCDLERAHLKSLTSKWCCCSFTEQDKDYITLQVKQAFVKDEKA